MTPEEAVTEAALDAGLDPEQALRGLARRRARTVPRDGELRRARATLTEGMQWCSMSSHMRPVEEFGSRKTCAGCREQARASMAAARARVNASS